MSWDPINLANLDPRLPIEPSVGGVNLIYPGKRHVFSGPPESAKTLAAYAIALGEIRRGENVLLVDFEMGQWDARDRLREMGATDEELEHAFYIEPDTPANEEIIENIISTWTFTLVLIDAAAGAYSLQALDDNKRADVEMFSRVYVHGFWLRGIATILVDHVVKNADHRGRFAIGSERKVGGADVHLGFEVVLPIKRGGRGLYRLLTHKDRFGHLQRPKAAELELRSDPDTHTIEWMFRIPDVTEQASDWRPTVLMERVSRYLESQQQPVLRSVIYRDVTGKRQYLIDAVRFLVADGYAQEHGGEQGTGPVVLLKPFRAEVPEVPGQFPGVPEAELPPCSPGSLPLKGGTGTGNLNGNGSEGRPMVGGDGYLERMFAAFEAGHITEGEWKRAERAHRFVVAGAA